MAEQDNNDLKCQKGHKIASEVVKRKAYRLSCLVINIDGFCVGRPQKH